MAFLPSPFPKSLLTLRPQRLAYLQDHNIPSAWFVHPVAEEEQHYLTSLLETPPTPIQTLASYATHQPLTLVVGSSGSGKTFARFFLEQQCRHTRGQLVVVVNEWDDIVTPETSFQTLIEAVIFDFLLYWITGKHSFETKAVAFLRSWLGAGGSSTIFLCHALLTETTSPTELIWQYGQRRVILTALTEAKKSLLAELLPAATKNPPVPHTYTYTLWNQLLQEVHVTGIAQICLLADCFTSAYTESQLATLTSALEVSSSIHLRLVAFLPYMPTVSAQVQEETIYSLTWTKQDLQNILFQRLKSQRTQGTLLYNFLSVPLVNRLLEKANGSPRHLLTLVNQTIESHLISQGEWLPIVEEEVAVVAATKDREDRNEVSPPANHGTEILPKNGHRL